MRARCRHSQPGVARHSPVVGRWNPGIYTASLLWLKNSTPYALPRDCTSNGVWCRCGPGSLCEVIFQLMHVPPT